MHTVVDMVSISLTFRLAIVVAVYNSATVDGQTSPGTEFAVTFPPTKQDDTTGTCAIIINSVTTTNFQVESVFNGTYEGEVAPGQPFQLAVPCTERTQAGTQDKVYYVTSDDDVSVIATNNCEEADEGQMDTTLVYPRSETDTEFYISVFVNPDGFYYDCGGDTNTASFFVISAYEDDTEVEIYETGTYELLDTITLNRFESYTNTTVVADRLYDFSGFYILSANELPIAVSAGSACTHYTYNAPSRESGVSWSYMPPLTAIQDGVHISYQIRSFPNSYYTVMGLATDDNTVITINGEDFELNRGEKAMVEFLNTWVEVNCDKPCLMHQVNQNYDEETGTFMMQISPVGGYNTRAVFSPPPTFYNWTDYVILTVPSPNYEVIAVQGLVADGPWVCETLVDTEACQRHFYFEESQAVIESTDDTVLFAAAVYGQGCCAEGYGFNAGFASEVSGGPGVTTTTPPATTTTATTTTTTTPFVTTTTTVFTTTTPPPFCPVAPPAYQITQRGTFTSGDGEDFSTDCTQAYSESLKDRAIGMITVVNSLIGSQICDNKNVELIQLEVASSSFITSGTEGEAYLYWTLAVGNNQEVESVRICANEIAAFLGDHENWNPPILPGEADCPEVVWTRETFNTTYDEWLCTQRPEEPVDDLEYGIELRAILDSVNSETITPECLAGYVASFQESTENMVDGISAEIGTTFCPNHVLTLRVIYATIFSGGTQAASVQDIGMENLYNATFYEVCACAEEISDYMQNHDNWEQPIIETPDGCPGLIFDPPTFREDEQYWLCRQALKKRK